MHLISNKTDLIHAYRKNMKYRKTCIAKSIAIFKNFLRKICHELGKHLPNSLSSIWQPTLDSQHRNDWQGKWPAGGWESFEKHRRLKGYATYMLQLRAQTGRLNGATRSRRVDMTEPACSNPSKVTEA